MCLGPFVDHQPRMLCLWQQFPYLAFCVLEIPPNSPDGCLEVFTLRTCIRLSLGLQRGCFHLRAQQTGSGQSAARLRKIARPRRFGFARSGAGECAMAPAYREEVPHVSNVSGYELEAAVAVVPP